MTTIYYTSDEWETIVKSATIEIARQINLFGHCNSRGEQLELRRKRDIAKAARRHGVALNTEGYTSTDDGCALCGKQLHYTEMDDLLDCGMFADICEHCQLNDKCPVCSGRGERVTKHLLSRDHLDAPEYATVVCDSCGGIGDYDSWKKRSS